MSRARNDGTGKLYADTAMTGSVPSSARAKTQASLKKRFIFGVMGNTVYYSLLFVIYQHPFSSFLCRLHWYRTWRCIGSQWHAPNTLKGKKNCPGTAGAASTYLHRPCRAREENSPTRPVPPCKTHLQPAKTRKNNICPSLLWLVELAFALYNVGVFEVGRNNSAQKKCSEK